VSENENHNIFTKGIFKTDYSSSHQPDSSDGPFRETEGDGQSEKAVQQAKRMIRAHVDDEQENWDVGLPQLAFARMTRMTPFEIMYGRRAKIPIDLAYPNASFKMQDVNDSQIRDEEEEDGVRVRNKSKSWNMWM